MRMLNTLGGPGWVKIGPVLFVREGPELIRDLRSLGCSVFLDLKWHDIPNTVRGAVRAAVDMDVQMATVHALGGPEMLETAAAESGTLSLVAVTMLTSHSADTVAQVLGRSGSNPVSEVRRLGEMALQSGVDGLVCSAAELDSLREAAPGTARVVPGIRPRGVAAGDQSRVATPGDAVRGGASHLVVGRPILEAEDPAGAYHEILEEISSETD